MMTVNDLINDIEYLNEPWTEDIPDIFEYRSNIYYLETIDGAFIRYRTKSGIDFKDRVDIYSIFTDVVEIKDGESPYHKKTLHKSKA